MVAMKADQINKYRKSSISSLQKRATKYFNLFIRLRDSDDNGNFTCISCGQMKTKAQINAGHFYSAGNNSSVRFNENNCWAQCVKCNMYMHGNLLPYQENLIKKIGQSDFDKLNLSMILGKGFYKRDRYSLIEIIEKYKAKSKELQKSKNY